MHLRHEAGRQGGGGAEQKARHVEAELGREVEVEGGVELEKEEEVKETYWIY